MIGEEELEAAIAEESVYQGASEPQRFRFASIELEPVRAYARRFAVVKDAAGAPYGEAAAGGFLLGFRLGVLAARNERLEG